MVRSIEWSAWYDHQPGGGSDRDLLRVAGKCEVDSSSVELSLEPTNEGIVDDPDVVVLALCEKRPDVGTDDMAVKDVSTEVREGGVKVVHLRGLVDEVITVEEVV